MTSSAGERATSLRLRFLGTACAVAAALYGCPDPAPPGETFGSGGSSSTSSSSSSSTASSSTTGGGGGGGGGSNACGRDCLGGACKGKQCTPYAFVGDMNERGIMLLAIFGDQLVAQLHQDARIIRIDRETRAVFPLIDFDALADQPTVEGLAVDGTHAYWTEGSILDEPRRVVRCALRSGCVAGAEQLVAPYPGPDGDVDLAVGSGHVYFAHATGGQGAIDRVLADGTQRKNIVAARSTDMWSLLLADGYVYWGEYHVGTFRASADGGGQVERIGTSTVGATAIAVDKNHVAWADWLDQVWILPLDRIGTAERPTLVASNEIAARAMALASGNLYWVSLGLLRQSTSTFPDSAVHRYDIAARSRAPIAESLHRARTLVIDDVSVFYGEAGDGDGRGNKATLWRWAR